MALTAMAIKNAKWQGKAFKLADGGGLYLFIGKASKVFRFDYRYAGKRKTLTIGAWPDISLKDARDRHQAARSQLVNGIDPARYKKQVKAAALDSDSSFESVSREWYGKQSPTWAASYKRTVIQRLEKNLFPWLGAADIGGIKPSELLSVLRRIESAGKLETARRMRQIAGQIFRYAISIGMADSDPAAALSGALAPPVAENMAAITNPADIGGLMRAIDAYHGYHVTRCALKLSALSFVRPGELRQAEWSETDLDQRLWSIPAGKMKMRRTHVVPLARQAIEVVSDLQPLTGHCRYLFPSLRTDKRPMSENAILSALRRMGFQKHEMTAHGFRAMASTSLYELGFKSHIVEMQLAHAPRNKIAAAYNHAEYLDERRAMMQSWADYLDSLRDGGQVIPIRKAG